MYSELVVVVVVLVVVEVVVIVTMDTDRSVGGRIISAALVVVAQGMPMVRKRPRGNGRFTGH